MARIAEQIIYFRRPVEILELWRSVRLYEKNEVPASVMHTPVDWSPFAVPVGCVDSDRLYLDPDAAAGIDLTGTRQLLLVADHPSGNHRSYLPAGLQALVSPKRLELDVVEVDSRDWSVFQGKDEFSRPRRPRFQAGLLRPGQTLEIRINEKSDGHHQRMYIEYNYLLRRSGPITEALLRAGPFTVVPPSARQLTDLRKPLW